jgi:molecular chaperone GrpE (heat shock protein)
MINTSWLYSIYFSGINPILKRDDFEICKDYFDYLACLPPEVKTIHPAFNQPKEHIKQWKYTYWREEPLCNNNHQEYFETHYIQTRWNYDNFEDTKEGEKQTFIDDGFNEMIGRFYNIVDKLTAKQEKILKLFLQDKKIPDVCKELNMTERSVKDMMEKIRKKIPDTI